MMQSGSGSLLWKNYECDMDLLDVGLIVEVDSICEDEFGHPDLMDQNGGQITCPDQSPTISCSQDYSSSDEGEGEDEREWDQSFPNFVGGSSGRVLEFSELENHPPVCDSGFSKSIRSYQVLNDRNPGGGFNSFSVLRTSSRTKEFKFVKNTMLFIHPLLRYGSDVKIKCFLRCQNSPSHMAYVISRNLSNPLQVDIIPQPVTLVSAQNYSAPVQTKSESIPLQVLDENDNHSEAIPSCELENSFKKQLQSPVHLDHGFKRSVSLEHAVSDHNYPKESAVMVNSPESILAELTNIQSSNPEEPLSVVNEEVQMMETEADTVEEETFKLCPSCGSQSQNYFCCDFCRRCIPPDARVLSRSVPQRQPASPENKPILRGKKKRQTSSSEASRSKKKPRLVLNPEVSSSWNGSSGDNMMARKSLSEPAHVWSTENSDQTPASISRRGIQSSPCELDSVTRIPCRAFFFGKHHIKWDDEKPKRGENIANITKDSVRFSMPNVKTLTIKSVIIPTNFISSVEVVTYAEVCKQKLRSVFLKLMKPLARNIARTLDIAADSQQLSQYGQDPRDTTVQLIAEDIDNSQLNYIKQLFGGKFKGETSNFSDYMSPVDSSSSLRTEDPSTKQCTARSTSQPSKISGQHQPSIAAPNPSPPATTLVQLPSVSTISIDLTDIAKLLPKQFLNDTMIDFWLTHIKDKIMKEEDRARTHVFSSYFYTSLTNRSQPLQPSAEKRHQRVRKWTKNVNIFSKDFVIVPINDNMHWYVAIICFPGLVRPQWLSDGSEIEGWHNLIEVNDKNEFALPPGMTNGQVIKPIKLNRKKSNIESIVEDYFKSNPHDPGSERAEAAKDDKEDQLLDDYYLPDSDELEFNEDVGAISDSVSPRVEQCEQLQNSREQRSDFSIKQPCILIFNSLPTFPRSRVLNTLREYLQEEYKKQNGSAEGRIFNKYTMPGFEPNVPQQKNFVDCGLYLLQYVEHFFKYPLTTYLLPLPHSMRYWFNEVADKRREIYQVIQELVKCKDPEALKLLPDFPTDVPDTTVPSISSKNLETGSENIIGGDASKPRGLEGAKAD